ncbi:hypothetical protein DRH14_01350 [Candidatus Shapirobacteria bacterium]|nr:MAG: hypothetical protein DRH14_01350 [Candidatus Shapirobacteria bacterium]
MIFVKPVYATCPVCVVAIGSGLVIAEKLGVDDLVASIWIGALLTAFAIAFGYKIKKIKFKNPEFSWSIIFYVLNVASFGLMGKLNQPMCKLWGIDKIFLGISLGTTVVWLGKYIDKLLRKINNNKVFVPFQKVLSPLLLTLILSLIFNYLIC